MIHIALCEDNREDLDNLRSMLYHTKISSDITGYTSAETMLFDMETGQKQFDLFFLDIYLPGLNGVEAAHRIRRTDENSLLVFLTSSEDFYREAFDLYAFHYLLKPIEQMELAEVMQKVAKRINRPEEMLQISFRRQNILLKQMEIMYISSYSHVLHFHMKDGQKYTSYEKLDTLETRLIPEQFVRCHKSFIVNLFYVDKMTPEGFYMGDTLVSISRSYAKRAREHYHNRLFHVFQNN
ncbi:MAG: response regulator transcription factor [Lachnospiraceae bacterium]|nr:response regulator transcription factor [Lachnospiraceae bacterium]